VLAFTAGLTLLTTLVFGLAPALGSAWIARPARSSIPAASPRERRPPRGVGARRHRDALAIVLLTGAGLVLRSFSQLLAVDPGFRAERVLTFDVQLAGRALSAEPARAAFYTRAFDALAHLDGVEAAGHRGRDAADGQQLDGGVRAGRSSRAGRPASAGRRLAGGERRLFTTLQIPLRAGRLFDATDRPGGPPVVIISEAIRDRFFPGGGSGRAQDPRRRRQRHDRRRRRQHPPRGADRRAARRPVFPERDVAAGAGQLRRRTSGIRCSRWRRSARRCAPSSRRSSSARSPRWRRSRASRCRVTRLALSLLAVFAVAALGR
jgi:hypothetical protein